MSKALPAPIMAYCPGDIAAPPRPPVGRLIGFGQFAGVLLLGGFGSWAALAPLSSASMAPGVVKVDSNRKTVQHLEGGIVREILVRDGDMVRQGQVLLHLDALDATADRDAARAQLVAQEARLVAQRDGATARRGSRFRRRCWTAAPIPRSPKSSPGSSRFLSIRTRPSAIRSMSGTGAPSSITPRSRR